ncbi:MAG TPA: rod shape-determining protein RodA [Alphaproteobacteria bacterium]|nr:rod shape-determining protein RodA [Alphaproteobacteria bacterium]USO04782.1 MAG: rod shape-determining protein RodA [Rhodospirillales bacterium]HOO81096.1 rod shape-determining protein RodA [Alphaproteobacteria bacterium]
MRHSIRLHTDQNMFEKLKHLNWGLILLITAVSCIGFAALYSAAGGNFSPWASKQMMRFGIAAIGMVIIAMIDLKWWFRLTWPLYFLGLGLLIIVEIMGHVGMGAQRWINLGFMQLQPSELMKIVVVMALARYFHAATIDDMRRLPFLVIPTLIILAPVALVLLQPDLGTSLMIVMVGAAMLFMAGASIWLYIGGGVLALASIPVAWHFMHDYQKQRVLTFLNPESDPLGAGYHITQSKIALGSGGINGKGFLEGTQSRLNFLPEKQTDFIFTLWAEEQGLFGGVILLMLFGLILLYGLLIALKSRQNFARYLALGLSVNFSLYVFINIAMVMGLIPVVGAPLPLISYGGTSMLAALIGFGLMMSCSLHPDTKVSR